MNGRGLVAFITVLIPDYKVWLYRRLDAALGGRLVAVHGPERRGTVPRDAGRLGIGRELYVRHVFLDLGPIQLTWIPALIWLLRVRPGTIILQDGVRILSNWVMHLVARAYGGKVLYYSHGYNHQAGLGRPGRVSRVTEVLRRWLLSRSNGVLVYSEGGRRHLAKHQLAVPVTVVGNTVAVPGQDLAVREGFGHRPYVLRHLLQIPDGCHVVAVLGRLVEEKRPQLFVDVIRALNCRMNVPVVGVFIGDGPLKIDLERAADSAMFRFLGHLTGIDLANALGESDLVFLPGMVGLAIVEAFAAGTPFAAVDASWHSPEFELLLDGETGFLVPDGTPDEIAVVLSRILSDAKKREEVADKARKLFEEHLHPESVVARFVEALNKGRRFGR